MAHPRYNNPQIPVSEQIRLLKSEGLEFHDEIRAQHILENISLFRMKSYLMPFRVSGSRIFKPNTSFEDAYSLYKFDSELRKMICSEMEKFATRFRSLLTKYPNVDIVALGFPSNWQDERLWQ